MAFDWAWLLGDFLGAAATAGSVFYAARQIRTAAEDQRRTDGWRRADSARLLMERLSANDEFAFCTRALDWGVGPLIIPVRYLPLFPSDQRTIEHHPHTMAKALSVNLQANWRAPEALTYRYCFDDFFTYLDQLRLYADRGLITRDDLIGADYYLKLIRSPPYFGADSGFDGVFADFLEHFYPALVPFIYTDPRTRP